MDRSLDTFDWPAVVEMPIHAVVADRIWRPILTERRLRNQEVWDDAARWRMGFYFGEGDTRLWVPRRLENGKANEEDRVINFAHPLGRRAFRILMLAYGIAAVAGVFFAMALAGVRW
ncbi:MAG: hypothetical protein KIT11_00825 [Fimbriimonadaceae bacterium]|nr:hypothetical protein [Fimbriimonadaceae bacterium]QYK55083.1 MAG: hypothetical protein KF733_08710 [Fimbriimonadaceae bacterium]